VFAAIMRPKEAAQRIGRRVTHAVGSLLSSENPRSLVKDEGGAVAMIFAITLFLVLSMVGGAVDLGRAYSAKAKLQAATDAASLAAASRYINDPDHNVMLAVQQGLKHFTASMANEPSATIAATLDEASKTVRTDASLTVKTPFLSLAGINRITVNTYSEATATENLSGGGSHDVELSLMLDITGSMGESAGNGQTKLQALKVSAKNLVDILIPNTSSQHVKIAIAPFAQTVNLGDDYIAAATGLPLTKTACTQTQTQCVNTTCKRYRSDGSCREWNRECSEVCTQTATTYLRRCVTDRMGANQFTDYGPSAGAYVPARLDTPSSPPSSTNDAYATSLSSAQSCAPAKKIIPLTTDKTVLKNHIDSFSTAGSTAGALGTAWAWYLLSPEWSGVFTGASAPRPYGTDRLKKIAVLMTDGTYNTEGAVQYSDGGSDSIRISNNAVQICSGMKARGIEVYTVGFKLDNDLARNTLRNCATDADHAFLAEDADQLEAVFREIAFRAVPIHVAK